MKKLMENIFEAIGDTPLLHLHRITDHYGVEGNIYAKLEYLNPGYSKKDRPALQMILEAEESGELKPGQTVIELTSGNTGTGLSLVCRAKGYPFIAVMSEGNSQERARMIFVLCPTVVYAEDAPGVYGDFYVVDNSTGAAVTAGNGVSYASGVLTVQRDGCRVKMKNGVTATTQRIIFDHRPTGSGHSQIILENVHINASDGIAIENKQGYADINFSGDCELIGTVGIQCDSGGGNVHELYGFLH